MATSKVGGGGIIRQTGIPYW